MHAPWGYARASRSGADCEMVLGFVAVVDDVIAVARSSLLFLLLMMLLLLFVVVVVGYQCSCYFRVVCGCGGT